MTKEEEIARLEADISKFMMKVSKFEFFLINRNIELCKVSDKDTEIKRLAGIQWDKLAVLIEEKYPFSRYHSEFASYGFSIFKDSPPQYLVKLADTGRLKWDSDECQIDSWGKLVVRGFAQLRNNIAHGNKALLPSQFTQGRTKEFIAAGDALMNFIAEKIFDENDWEKPIQFHE